MLLEGGLGMGVQPVAPLCHFGVKIGDAIDDRHDRRASLCVERSLARPALYCQQLPASVIRGDHRERLRSNRPRDDQPQEAWAACPGWRPARCGNTTRQTMMNAAMTAEASGRLSA